MNRIKAKLQDQKKLLSIYFTAGYPQLQDTVATIQNLEKNGVDMIVVSNHGGRAQVDARGTIEVLPEVVAAVNGRIPVMVDGGIRRGSDIYKALALGATAVDIGRPYLWGLGAFGQEGVERVIDIFDAELKIVMQQTGATSTDQISKEALVF